MKNYILTDIRQGLGLEPDDESSDKAIMQMSPNDQFYFYCQWNGLLGWSGALSEVVLELFKEEI